MDIQKHRKEVDALFKKEINKIKKDSKMDYCLITIDPVNCRQNFISNIPADLHKFGIMHYYKNLFQKRIEGTPSIEQVVEIQKKLMDEQYEKYESIEKHKKS